MTDELDCNNDFECSNEFGVVEEDADKLNDVTFGDEIAWNYNNLNLENDDSNFEQFPFDDFEVNKKEQNEFSFERNESDSNNLLGLKGSFFNFGLFKTRQKTDSNLCPSSEIDNDFETAMDKLRLMEADDENDSDLHDFDSLLGVISGMGAEFEVSSESPFLQLKNYSELLLQQFLDFKVKKCKTQFLNTVVTKHLNLLKKKLIQLSLTMDVLVQLKYFNLLTTFTTVDNRINAIYARCSNDPRLLNAEMISLVHQFYLLPLKQQEDIATMHPFFSGVVQLQKNIPPLMQSGNFIGTLLQSVGNFPIAMPYNGMVQGVLHPGGIIRGPLLRLPHTQGTLPIPSIVNSQPLIESDGGWMLPSERDWILKVQTRNLASDNPYIHDYYYTILKFRELCEARESQLERTGETTIPDPISMLPSPITADQLSAGIDPTKEGIASINHPFKLDNSLGVVSVSNLSTPRQTIEVPMQRQITVKSKAANDSYAPIRAHRELLGLIERLYDTVLRIDEVDKSLAKMLVEQHHYRGVLMHHRNTLLQILMDFVSSDYKFIQMFTVSKGVRVLSLVIAVVASAQFVQIIKILFVNFLSLSRSDCFAELESQYRSIIASRIKILQKFELSQLITTFFNPVTLMVIDRDQSQVQLLSSFCNTEFGLYIVFTTLGAFSVISPGDKEYVDSLVDLTIKCSGSEAAVQNISKGFQMLFPG